MLVQRKVRLLVLLFFASCPHSFLHPSYLSLTPPPPLYTNSSLIPFSLASILSRASPPALFLSADRLPDHISGAPDFGDVAPTYFTLSAGHHHLGSVAQSSTLRCRFSIQLDWSTKSSRRQRRQRPASTRWPRTSAANALCTFAALRFQHITTPLNRGRQNVIGHNNVVDRAAAARIHVLRSYPA